MKSQEALLVIAVAAMSWFGLTWLVHADLRPVPRIQQPAQSAPRDEVEFEGTVGLAAMGQPTESLFGAEAESGRYSFLVAGHVYGDHGGTRPGLFPPFESSWRKHPRRGEIRFAVLLGDMVRVADTSSFEALDRDLATFAVPVFAAPGNHDLYIPPAGIQYSLFVQRYRAHRKAFRIGEDAYVVADTVSGGGRLSDADLDALRVAVDLKPRSLFVFVHHLIWADKKSDRDGTIPKRTTNAIGAGYAEDARFVELLQLLKQSAGLVFVFAGDVGAGSRADESWTSPEPNVHLIATGMGEHADVGSYLLVEVGDEGVTLWPERLAKEQNSHPADVAPIPARLFPYPAR